VMMQPGDSRRRFAKTRSHKEIIMSGFAMLHTAISILPLGFGLAAFQRNGLIDPKTRVGKWYIVTMLAGTISSWGFLLTKGFNEAQVLTLITLFAVLGSLFTLRGTLRPAGYIRTVGLSFSYLLLWVFTTTETLTRVPMGQPFAKGADDPALIPVRLVLLAMFAIGVGYQTRNIRNTRKVAAPALTA
jgi:hypothetical protein